MNYQGTLFTVSAPSGAGKTSLVKALVERTENLQVSVSHTTRPIRPGEQDGVNYHFVDQTTFLDMVGKGQFLEHAKVFANYYGTSKHWVEQQLNAGLDVILEIDWQGAQQVRKHVPEAVGVFILPPSRDTLLQRLTARAQDQEDVIEARMAEARSEISHYVEADYLVVNDVFEQALIEFQSVVLAQRQHLEKQQQKHQNMLQELLS